MVQLIRCGIPSKKIIFPFFIPIFVCFRILMVNEINNNGFITANHPFILIMFMFIGELLNGILVVISYLCRRSKKKEVSYHVNSDLDSSIVLFKARNVKSSNWHYLLICLAASIDFINMTGLLLIPSQANSFQSNNLECEMKIVQIIFTSILSYFILAIKVFRHQYLGVLLIIIGIGLLFIEQQIDYFLAVPFFLLFFCSSSCQEVIEKWLLHKKNLSTFRILFIEGATGICLCNLAILISSHIPCQWEFCALNNSLGMMESFNEGFKALFAIPMNGLFLFGYIVGSFCLNLSTMKTSEHFTATHRTVSDSLASFIWGIIALIQGYSVSFSWGIQIPAYIVITLGCLVYNEIIVLLFCNLGENTKNQIRERQKTEYDKALVEMENIESQKEEEEVIPLEDNSDEEDEGKV